MFVAAALAIGVAMVLTFIRLCTGPTLYDRVAAVNAFGTETVLLIGVIGFLTGRPDFLDIALLYALISFVGTIAVLKFFRYRALGDPVMTRTPDATPDARKNAVEAAAVAGAGSRPS
ncbi:MAG: cation:proton antiporter [Paracoccaceae bacterium]|nr:cation:proton antiporter [Paracoccaceae bacterium]